MFDRVFFLMWYMHKEYHCLRPSPFLQCIDERFRPHLEINSGEDTPAKSFSPQCDPFHFYIYNAKMFPTVLFAFECLQEFWWPASLWMSSGEWLWAWRAVLLPQPALLLLQSWANRRRSLLHPVLCPGLAALFLVSSSVSSYICLCKICLL